MFDHVSPRTSIRRRHILHLLVAFFTFTGYGAHAATPDSAEGQFDLAFAAIEHSLDSVPPEQVDLAALQRSIGAEPEALRDWVIDNTRWVPYEGALKGPMGVFLARQGNGLDRALLLAHLSILAGYEARIASTVTPADLVDAVVARAQASMAKNVSQSADGSDEKGQSLDDLAKALGISRGEVIATIGKADVAAAEQRAAMQARAALHEEQLLSVLGSRLPTSDENKWAQRVRAAVANHYRVQVRKSGGLWQDLDLLYPEGVPDALRAGTTFSPNSIPDALEHKVSIDILVTTNKDEEEREHVVFTHDFSSPDMATRELVLHFSAVQAREIEAVAAGTGGDDAIGFLREELTRHATWVPALSFRDGESIVDKAFTRDGRVLTDIPTVFSGVQDRVGDAASIFSTLGSKPATTENDGRVVSVRVLYRITRPGRDDRQVTRMVYTEDPSRNVEERELALAAALTRQTRLLMQTGHISGKFVVRAAAERLMRLRLPVRYLLNQAREGASFEMVLPKVAERMRVFPVTNLALAAARNGQIGDDVFLAETNLLSEYTELLPPDGIAPIGREMIDILANARSVVGADGFRGAMSAGIWDSVAETFTAPDPQRAFSASNAWTFLSGDVRLLTNNNDLDNAGLPGRSRAVLAADLDAGYWVVIGPDANKNRLSWWRIDPVSGDILGKISNGQWVGGGQNAETVVKKKNQYSHGAALRKFDRCDLPLRFG